MTVKFYLVVLLHVGSYFAGPFDSVKDCIAKAAEQPGYVQTLCVQGVQVER
jgi:hypothetical protein